MYVSPVSPSPERFRHDSVQAIDGHLEHGNADLLFAFEDWAGDEAGRGLIMRVCIERSRPRPRRPFGRFVGRGGRPRRKFVSA